MLRRFTKKRVIVALTAIAVVAVAATAFAYLTASGSGSGSGSVTASDTAMTLSLSNTPALTHIGDSETYEITASNTGASPEHVSGISVSSIGPSSAAASAGCPAGSFTADTPTTTGTEVPAATDSTHPGTAVVGHVVVHFVDQPSAQNACQGTGTVAVSLTSN